MHYKLAILLNDIAQIEYDRSVPLESRQADHLSNMDKKMANGFSLGEKQINDPDQGQKAEFVASNLYHAIKGDNEAMASAMTSYLAVYIADLKQVKFDDKDGEVSIELVYDKEYTNQVGVQFTTH
ncbi:MAG: hypothetical protein V3V09_06895 [Arenicellales bacterium]